MLTTIYAALSIWLASLTVVLPYVYFKRKELVQDNARCKEITRNRLTAWLSAPVLALLVVPALAVTVLGVLVIPSVWAANTIIKALEGKE